MAPSHRFSIVLLAAICIFLPQASLGDLGPGALGAQRLRCEYLTDPRGVDRTAPELSWIVASDSRDQVQTAYRVLVASSLQKLSSGEGDLWDSGKVDGDATYGVAYAGAELQSHQQCFWKVMTWDRDGKPGPWSESAKWTVGVLDPQEWKGEWIGYDAHRHLNSNPPGAPLDGAKWVCLPADAKGQAPAETRVFYREWELPADAEGQRATLVVAADDNATVLLNDVEVAGVTALEHPKTEQVGAYLRRGVNTLRVLTRNGSPGPTGLALKLTVQGADGRQDVIATDSDWLSAKDDAGDWRKQTFDDAAKAKEIGDYGDKPWGELVIRRDVTAPPSYLRGKFAVKKPVRRATAYLASLGFADLSLNGKPVNEDYFSSGWTDYRKRIYYRAYDVTDTVLQGENAWGAVLADGWYSGHVAWGAQRDHYGTKPRFRAMLRVEYEDGTHDTFATDRSWTVTEGPTQIADMLVGEEYDATKEVPGWDQPRTAIVTVGSVDVGAEVSPEIEWHPGPPVVGVEEFPAQSVNEPVPGVYVYDIGQNMAGVARLKLRGKKGQRVQLRFAERLNPDGTLYVTNLRLARAVDYYICKGEGEEVWQPRQTFHGFQYVELTGVDEQPPLDAVTGVALSSDTPIVNEFECSDPKLNRLYKNILWTQLSNFIDVPTDCPQRDERLGWTGDAQVYVMTAARITDVQAFFRKWLVDLADAQRQDGQLPCVAPVLKGLDDGGPAWSDAGVICPWEVYQAYGDRDLLAQQYPSMVRFVEFCRNRSKDGLLPPDNFHAYGDWLSVKADTPKEVIYMAYYARSVDLLRRSAAALGKTDDAKTYGNLFDRIKATFNKEFVTADGKVRGDTQACYVLAIGYGLIDGDVREQAAKRLVDDIEGRGWKLSTGFVGTKDLMLVLSQIGRDDVALKLLHQAEYPGWLFSLAHGATSIWERWDGWTPERGFQDPGMNSFAHYSFGAVYGWMSQHLGGIRCAAPGYAEIVIQPTFDPQLEHCRIKYDSIRGAIETEWSGPSDARELRVVIPANTKATVRLTDVSSERVSVVGKSVKAVTVKPEGASSGPVATEFKLGSGEYVITVAKEKS
jgi:alpha-L-rhamnosidase